MKIRSAADDDWPRIGELAELLVRMHHAFDDARFMHPDLVRSHVYAARVRDEVGQGHSMAQVADADDRVVGYVFAGIEAESWKEQRHRAGYIHDIVVEEAYRHRGIARALVASAIEWIAAQGVAPVMLWTAPQNTDAQRLFASLGFRPTMIEMTLDAVKPARSC